ncbi:MAG: hypothetical protein HC822_24885 [Oscillochloris sp.]|nr:hypothetical protein [Oscillochloris sp.]
MEATNTNQINRSIARTTAANRGIFGRVGDRTAQILAAVITTGVFGMIGYALNTFFTSLSAGA